VNGGALANSSRWFAATIWQGEHRASAKFACLGIRGKRSLY